MKVFVIGSGGREHAICECLKKSPKVDKIFAAPANAGIAQIAECVNIGETDTEKLLDFALNNQIDLTVVGPEISLAAGVADVFQANGLKIFAPTKRAAQIESSKEFAKNLMKKYEIPTAEYQVFGDYNAAIQYVTEKGAPIVLKYDGLAAGKGVVVAQTFDEAKSALEDMLLHRKFGDGKVVVEEFLDGQEFSFMCLVNGENVFPLELAQDHKRAFDGDKGANTGGMGAYSPLPFISENDKDFALKNIMQKTANALISEGCSFCGVLYGGLIKTRNEIKVIEFNARFGDPETEVVLPRLKSDLFDIFNDVIDGKMPDIQWNNQCSLGVVLASKGYPEHYEKGFEIKNLDKLQDVEIYQMGTKQAGHVVEAGRAIPLLTNGGRVLFITALGDNLKQAREKVLTEIAKIDCENLFWRKDIGHQAINN
ncbi:MAG: phosphoribosylamine--glycine ligase [Prevotellaceae bacterium]|jgi:phosphoribosylamine--glycine ligase|nr:phosphoribosylamine--glycine ligase [Prevotellaceae bacterium]